MKYRTKTAALAASVVFSSAALVGMAAAPEAKADSFIRTQVNWVGAPCIAIYFGWSGDTRVVCGGSYTLTEGNAWYGDQIGLDPIMGAASYINCKLWINGALSWADAAYAGDGSDVNCHRTLLV